MMQIGGITHSKAHHIKGINHSREHQLDISFLLSSCIKHFIVRTIRVVGGFIGPVTFLEETFCLTV